MNYLKILKEFQSLGCSNEIKCSIACRTYIELCDAKALWNVEYKYCSEFDIIYLQGSKTQDSLFDIYIPIISCQEIDIELITKWQQNFYPYTEKPSIILAICDPDSTILYYKMTNGWKDLEPEDVRISNNKQNKLSNS